MDCLRVFGQETFRETKMLNSIPVDPDSGKYYKYMLSEDKSKFILEANLNNDSLFTLDESLNNNKNINDSDGSSGDNNDNVENPDIPPQYIPPAPWPETNIDCFTFRSTTWDNYEITWYKSDICPDSYEIVIPKTYNWKNISSIWSSAFKDVPIFRLFIPSHITQISNRAFAKSTTFSWTKINELIVWELDKTTDNIISIYAYAFHNNDIRKITLGNSVKNVDANIFNKAFNNLSYLNLGNRIESIWTSTFANQKLSSLVIPDSITTIWSSAFKNNSITSVHIPNPNCTYTNAFDSHVTITN